MSQGGTQRIGAGGVAAVIRARPWGTPSRPDRRPAATLPGPTEGQGAPNGGSPGIRGGSRGDRRSWRERAVALAKGLAGVAAAVGVWELLRATAVLPPRFAPSFPTIVSAAARGLANGSLLGPLGTTLTAWFFGLAMALAVGLAVGALIGTWRWAAAAARVLVRFLRPVPSVALIPVAILAAGLGLKMTLILVVFASVWPILINTAYGVREVPELYRDTGRVIGLSRRQVLLRITLPASLPAVATGIRVAAAIALVVAVSAELITGAGGLGGFILNARLSARYGDAYAVVLLGGLLGYLINSAAVGLERRVLFWSAANRSRGL